MRQCGDNRTVEFKGTFLMLVQNIRERIAIPRPIQRAFRDRSVGGFSQGGPGIVVDFRADGIDPARICGAPAVRPARTPWLSIHADRSRCRRWPPGRTPAGLPVRVGHRFENVIMGHPVVHGTQVFIFAAPFGSRGTRGRRGRDLSGRLGQGRLVEPHTPPHGVVPSCEQFAANASRLQERPFRRENSARQRGPETAVTAVP
jgi:hypothetical protein